MLRNLPRKNLLKTNFIQIRERKTTKKKNRKYLKVKYPLK